jgi:hypothetical protein
MYEKRNNFKPFLLSEGRTGFEFLLFMIVCFGNLYLLLS